MSLRFKLASAMSYLPFAVSTVSGLVRIYSVPTVAGETGTNRTTVSPDGRYYARREQRTNAVVYHAASDRIVNSFAVDRNIDYLELSREGREILVRQTIGADAFRFEVREVATGRIRATNVLDDGGGAISVRTATALPFDKIDN